MLIIDLKDQISILVSLFASFAGISATVLSFIITAYILRRGTTNKPTGMFKSDAVLLTAFFGNSLITFVVSYFAISEALMGRLINNKLFVYSDSTIAIFPSIVIILVNLGIILICVDNAKKRKIKNIQGKYLLEIGISVFLIAMSLFILYLYSTNNSVPATTPLVICIATLSFGMIQIWTTIRKENRN